MIFYEPLGNHTELFLLSNLSPAEQRVFIEQGIEAQGYKCALYGGPL